MKNRFLTIPLAIVAIAILLSVSGCSSGGATNSPATPAPTGTPTPTPVPVYSFGPQAKTWPVNVTDHTYVLYKRTNNLVNEVSYWSWEYTTLTVNNTTKIQRLVFNDTSGVKDQRAITDAYFEIPSGKFINATQTLYAGTTPFEPVNLMENYVISFDMREMADWYSATYDGGNATITVPAGTFDCKKYESHYQNYTTSAIWMADYVPAPVKREMYGNNQTNVVYELLAYKME